MGSQAILIRTVVLRSSNDIASALGSGQIIKKNVLIYYCDMKVVQSCQTQLSVTLFRPTAGMTFLNSNLMALLLCSITMKDFYSILFD